MKEYTVIATLEVTMVFPGDESEEASVCDGGKKLKEQMSSVFDDVQVSDYKVFIRDEEEAIPADSSYDHFEQRFSKLE